MNRLKDSSRNSRVRFHKITGIISIFISIFLFFIICTECVNLKSKASVFVSVTEPEGQSDENEAENYSGFPQHDLIKKYLDVVLGVAVSISIAFASVTATIFIFSKSSLDRIIDENENLSDFVNEHKSNNIKSLVWVYFVNALLVIFPIVWHLAFSFFEMHSGVLLYFGLILMAILAVIYVVMCIYFWYSCICVEKFLGKIIKTHKENTREDIMAIILKNNRSFDDIMSIIGDWTCWEDKADKNEYALEGKNLCRALNKFAYLSLFDKAEKLLLSVDFNDKVLLNNSEIITMLEDRKGLLESNISVEKNDMKGRTYTTEDDIKIDVFKEITNLHERIGLKISKGREGLIPNKSFFDDMRAIYESLKVYANILVAEQYTKYKTFGNIKDKNSNKRERSISQSEHSDQLTPEGTTDSELFAAALYYFFIKILSAFTSSVQIRGLLLNGCSLNYADFYSSTLQNVTMYSADCFRTIFNHAHLINVIFDISRLCEIDFYSTKIEQSYFNNAKFERVIFERAVSQDSSFGSGVFCGCGITDSIFNACEFDNSVYDNTSITHSNFSKSSFKCIQWKNVSIVSDCVFNDSVIHDWTAYDHFSLENCDFSNSIWSKTNIVSWSLKGSVFTAADLSDIKIIDSDLTSTSFTSGLLPNALINNSYFTSANFEQASFFRASICNSKFTSANMDRVLAINAHLTNSDFPECSMAGGDFSSAIIKECNLKATRLYDASFTKAKIENSNLQYILADHLQITSALCVNVKFDYGSLSDSNFSGTEFINCNFVGSDMSNATAINTRFENCKLNYTDFSNSRIVFSKFESQSDKMIISMCNFTNCIIERTAFNNVVFCNCIFDNTIFMNCTKYSTQKRPLRIKDIIKSGKSKGIVII